MEVKGLRFVILVVSTLAVSILISDCLTLNFTIICLIDDSGPSAASATNNSRAIVNGSKSNQQIGGPTYNWSRNVQTMLLSSFAWSAICAVIPFTWALRRYGTRICYLVVALLSATAVFASPWAASISPYAFLFCRIMLGVGFAGAFPIPGAVIASWAGPGENGLFVGLLASAMQIAPIITMPMAGPICRTKVGWPMVYYVHGILTLLSAAVMTAIYREGPQQHPWCTEEDRKAGPTRKKSSALRVPYKAVFSSLPVWAIMVATFGNMWGIQLLLYFTPTYLKKVLGFDVSNSGYLSAIPSLAMFIVKFCSGFLSDRFLHDRPTLSVRIFNSVAFCLMAACFASLGFITNKYFAYVILVLSMGFMGIHAGGFFRSVPLIAGPFNSLVMSGLQLTSQIILVILPPIANALTPTESLLEWRTLFLITAAVLVTTNIFFVIVGSGQMESWARNPRPVTAKNVKSAKNTKNGDKVVPTELGATGTTTKRNGSKEPIKNYEAQRSYDTVNSV